MSVEKPTDACVAGLKVKMTSAEMAAHCAARAVHHRARRDEKKAQVPNLEAAAAAIKAQTPASVAGFSKMSNTSSYGFDGDNAISSLNSDIEAHHNKSVWFDWLAAHLFAEDYCLDRGDLQHLEIIK